MANQPPYEYNVLKEDSPFYLNSGKFEELWALQPKEYILKLNPYNKHQMLTTKRKLAVYGAIYSFSGNDTKEENAVPEILKPFLALGNSVLVNWYNGDEEYIDWHFDQDGPHKGKFYPNEVHSFSYGATREFAFKGIYDEEVKYSLKLGDNSYVKMDKCAQRDFKHSVPRGKNKDSRRINVTVRSIPSVNICAAYSPRKLRELKSTRNRKLETKAKERSVKKETLEKRKRISVTEKRKRISVTQKTKSKSPFRLPSPKLPSPTRRSNSPLPTLKFRLPSPLRLPSPPRRKSKSPSPILISSSPDEPTYVYSSSASPSPGKKKIKLKQSQLTDYLTE